MNEKTVKICLMVSNIICLFVGLATLIIGILIYALETFQNILTVMSSNVTSETLSILSLIMIAIGAFIVFLSFLGCCGAMNESKCMIGIYCIILFLMLGCQLAVGILGVVNGTSSAKKEFKSYYMELLKSASEPIPTIEKTFKCCGYDGYTDYISNYVAPTTPQQNLSSRPNTTSVPTEATTMTTSESPVATMQESTTKATINVGQTTAPNITVQILTTEAPAKRWPESCCKQDESGNYLNVTACLNRTRHYTSAEKYVNTKGCKDELNAFIKQYEIIIGGVSLGFVILELVSLIAGCCLYKSLD